MDVAFQAGPVSQSLPNYGLVAPDEQAKGLSGQAMTDAVKRAAEGTGLNMGKISGHSLHRGHLTTAAYNGTELVDLQRRAPTPISRLWPNIRGFESHGNECKPAPGAVIRPLPGSTDLFAR